MIFNIPTIFAVITAIVTIEPTATDSIKRTYSLSGLNNWIGICHDFHIFPRPPSNFLCISCNVYDRYMSKLRLHAGTLVATLTAVAMIPITANHYFTGFLIRLATTSTGIIVSTLVNFFIFPPHYTKMILDVQRIYLLKQQILWKNGLLH